MFVNRLSSLVILFLWVAIKVLSFLIEFIVYLGRLPNSFTHGCSLFCTIADDYSRNTWVYLMWFKFETYTCLRHIRILIKNQFSCSVHHIRTDNEQEFLSNRMQLFFHKQGIVHECTCVETPQQNGVVERKHRQLLNVVWCLQFQANLSITF